MLHVRKGYDICHEMREEMREFADQLILFLFGFISLAFLEPDYYYICGLLLVLIYISIGNYKENKTVMVIATTLIVVMGIFLPVIYFFLPVLLYGALLTLSPYISIPMTAISLYTVLEAPVYLILLWGFGTTLSFYLRYKTKKEKTLEAALISVRDDGIERTLLLKEKNQALLETKDYEIVNATLMERNRIAREIHDNVGHMLSRTILMVAALKSVSKEETTKGSLEVIDESLNTAMDSIRESVHNLHDESLPLEKSIKDIVNGFTYLPITLDYDADERAGRDVKYALIGILKEGLNNITKHSNGTRVTVSVTEHPAMYQMIIRDNGTDIKNGRGQGIGLKNIEDRVEALKGTARIDTNNGFKLFISIPKECEGSDEVSYSR